MKKCLIAMICCLFSTSLFAQYFAYPRLPQKAKRITQFIPSGWDIRDSAHGDLNGDQVEDLALTIQYKDTVLEMRPDSVPNEARPRILLILLRDPKRPRYQLQLQHNTFILREGEGGMMQDPPTDIVIKNNQLTLEVEFTRSHIYYTFQYRNNDFYLTAVSTANVSSDQFENWDFNFAEGKAIHETGPINEDNTTREERSIPDRRLKKLRDLTMPFLNEVFPDVFY